MNCSAMGAKALISPCWSLRFERGIAMNAISGVSSIFGFREFSANGTYENVSRMSGIAGQKIAGEQIDIFTAKPALAHFDIKEILDLRFFRAADLALGAVQVPDLGPEV
jgi:hypothetical protein